MLSGPDIVILLDVDNTLFDNDRFKDDLRERLLRDFGPERSAIYWKHYDALREQLGYVDYLAALQRLRLSIDETPELKQTSDLLQMSSFLLDYPFTGNLYPGALDAISHLRTLGAPAIFSDGDIVFQPRKIQRSGLWDAVAGRVEITVHKERSLDALRVRFPAAHYVMVDDKPQLLSAMKRIMGDDLATVFVQQGHYAAEAAGLALDPPPDRTVDCIAELCNATTDWLYAPSKAALTGAT
ncbi:MAG TPA: HAD family hydrolase [Xanthomonadaceae bacterium]